MTSAPTITSRTTVARLVSGIDEFNTYFRQATDHPLIGVGELSRADLSIFGPTDFGMYCVVLMDDAFGTLHKGGRTISYKANTLFSLRPGEEVWMDLDHTVHPAGWMLAFRPELLEKTGLGRDFYMFNFFSSDVDEAMELTPVERGIIINCFSNLVAELKSDRDYMSDQLLRLGIGQMLSYFKRFYERQFSHSVRPGASLAERLDNMVDNYLSSGLPAQKGQPTVAWCASQFNLSPNYFGDIIKRELHISAQEYLQQKLIMAAQRLLSDTSLSINDIAEELGFAYPNHFARMFRRRVGVPPLRYRKDLHS